MCRNSNSVLEKSNSVVIVYQERFLIIIFFKHYAILKIVDFFYNYLFCLSIKTKQVIESEKVLDESLTLSY